MERLEPPISGAIIKGAVGRRLVPSRREIYGHLCWLGAEAATGCRQGNLLLVAMIDRPLN